MRRKPDPYGRDARRPYHIPLRGWWQVVQRVWTESGRDNLSVVAAGCAFFALFAIFPALSALISLYGLSADPATVEQQFGMLADVLPARPMTSSSSRFAGSSRHPARLWAGAWRLA